MTDSVLIMECTISIPSELDTKAKESDEAKLNLLYFHLYDKQELNFSFIKIGIRK